MKPAIGVIGTGAMGLAVVQSWRAPASPCARDIRAEAQAAAVASGAVHVAEAFGCEVPLALAARAAFTAAMAAGYGAEDDASLLRLRLGPNASMLR